jgi:peptidyl-tRNA hydrolase
MPPGVRASQLCHAMREFVAQHPEIDQEWYRNSNYLALLEVPNETDLRILVEKADDKKLRCSVFHEPDRDNEMTAIALEPGIASKKLLSSLRLAFKDCSAGRDKENEQPKRCETMDRTE